MKNLRCFELVLVLMVLPFLCMCQSFPFEIFGTLKGDYNSKMYLFFEGNYRQKDSLSSEIKNGRFYFKGIVPALPVMARLHMDQTSYIQDVYIDNNRTDIDCSTSITLMGQGKDTMNKLVVNEVKGSEINKLKHDFETWTKNLEDSTIPDEQKGEALYQKLLTFINKYPKSKLSPYFLGKAHLLSFNQVKSLSALIDSSLAHSFEMKSVTHLYNGLYIKENKLVGFNFHDFVLPDSAGYEIDSRKFRGKYTLIVFWASWCKPCRNEHPDLNNLYEKYKAREFDMVGVSLDRDREKWINAVIRDQLQWPQVIDPNAFNGEVAKYYSIEAVPASFLLDKTGKIIATGLTPGEVVATIEKLL